MEKGDLELHQTSCLFSRSPCHSKVLKAGNDLQVKEGGGILLMKICLPFVTFKLKKLHLFLITCPPCPLEAVKNEKHEWQEAISKKEIRK